jgi:hypothetical protein
VSALRKAGALLAALFALVVAVGAVASVADASKKGAEARFQRLDREEPEVKVWVGAACKGGGMAVAMSLETLAPYDCRDQWTQTLTEGQVRGMGVR